MDKNEILVDIKQLREIAVKRNFEQTFDLIVSLKNLNLKKPENNVNTFYALPHSKGKKAKVCAFVSNELITKAKASCDLAILASDFGKYDKKAAKKLAAQYDFFIAQGNLMAQIATVFGKVLGPRGKMPNPKAGCVVQATDDLKPVVERLHKTVRIQTKNELAIKVPVGVLSMKDEDVAENILHVYNTLLQELPQEKNNIRRVLLKLTMSKPISLREKQEVMKK